MTQPTTAIVATFADLLIGARHDGPIWSTTSEQLNINLLRLSEGASIATHTNNEVDVLGVVVEGEGVLMVGTTTYALQQGQMFVIPRGAERSLHASSPVFAYLSCHRRRPGLMPELPQ